MQSTNDAVSWVFSGKYLDSDGAEQHIHSQGASSNMTVEGVPSFENMFVVKNYETGPITLYVQWAPPQQLDETIIVPLTEA